MFCITLYAYRTNTLFLEIYVDGFGFGFFFALEDILSLVVHHCSLLIKSCLQLEKKKIDLCVYLHIGVKCVKKGGECTSNLLTLFFHKTSSLDYWGCLTFCGFDLEIVIFCWCTVLC